MIALIHPFIAHYREEFFKLLSQKIPVDVYVYEDNKSVIERKFSLSSFNTIKIFSILFEPFLFYNPLPFFKKKYTIYVLMLNFGHLTTWALLLTKKIHRRKIILWGHGISVKRYLDEFNKPSLLLKLMIYLCDGVWFYTNKEKEMWQVYFPDKKMVSLNNTVQVVKYVNEKDKSVLKHKLNIYNEVIIIFCARFNTNFRRADILEKLICNLDPIKFGFIIIGSGKYKPDFKKYSNVYDFDSLYDDSKKAELFYISDIYFQPAWLGLSIVEAMSYGLPIFSFVRSKDFLQCVEYSYVIDKYNGLLFQDFHDCYSTLNQISFSYLTELGSNSKLFYDNNLQLNSMVSKALSII